MVYPSRRADSWGHAGPREYDLRDGDRLPRWIWYRRYSWLIHFLLCSLQVMEKSGGSRDTNRKEGIEATLSNACKGYP